MHKISMRVFAALLFLAAAIVSLPAQTSTGSIRGEVEDQNGGRIAAATIVVESKTSGLQRTVKSDAHGEFPCE